MSSVKAKSAAQCHVVAMPYPGRGHINPMMNLCKTLASKNSNILVTFVVTEEWLGFIGSDPKPDNIRFGTIPNVIPSELVRAADMYSFGEAIWTKLEAPFVRLLDQLEPPVTVIMADTFLFWAVGVGNRRNIPVASFWPMSQSMFTIIQHVDLLVKNGHFPADSAKSKEHVDYIPGISSIQLVNIPFDGRNQKTMQRILEVLPWVNKAQYLLLTSIYELESKVFDVLKAKFSFPVYAMGEIVPNFDFGENTKHNDNNYLHWLDCQPRSSVLYVSMGSFLSVSIAQMDEIAVGLRDSGVRFFWVARDETSRLKELCGHLGLVVPWCNQLKVLSHSSVGGFLSHCGWSSTREGMLCGIPFLTFPIIFDQILNSKLIVEDWKIGWRVKQDMGMDNLVTRVEISRLVQEFMNLENDEVKEIRTRASKFQQVCQRAIAKGGSSETSINAFIQDLPHCMVIE
nr:UDP-glycosyltransferase 87A1-like [Quercus suber]XP_023926675.1 UDP-glycosyltransferase 87A1-like [Quercus suber]POE92797.1 udp-glycosyltransferase 87a1 [Quercus suber]